MKIGNKEFKFGKKTYVIGILNITLDSFSDGGKFYEIDNAMQHVKEMIEEGADIIDIGGESTKPGYTMISEEEEIARIIPVIKAIKKEFDIPISVDTYKSAVAKAAIEAGADLINDIWGLKYDPNMAHVIKESNAAVCIVHNRDNIQYEDFMKDVLGDLKKSIQIAEEAGIPDNKIILDPGIGFGKNYEMNLEVMRNLEQFHQFGQPILLGTSRKSMIGLTLDLPIEEREEGTITTTIVAFIKGCEFVRVHNVKGNIRALKMAEAIY